MLSTLTAASLVASLRQFFIAGPTSLELKTGIPNPTEWDFPTRKAAHEQMYTLCRAGVFCRSASVEHLRAHVTSKACNSSCMPKMRRDPTVAIISASAKFVARRAAQSRGFLGCAVLSCLRVDGL